MMRHVDRILYMKHCELEARPNTLPTQTAMVLRAMFLGLGFEGVGLGMLVQRQVLGEGSGGPMEVSRWL